MSRSDDFYDSVNMHHVTPENLSIGANSIALGDVHNSVAKNHETSMKSAAAQGNQRLYDFHEGIVSDAYKNASKAYGKTITSGSKTATFQYSAPNVDYLS